MSDAVAVEQKCELGRTVYLLRECSDGRRNHILICGQGAGSFESGDALEFTEETYRFKFANDRVVLLCPKSGTTCTVSVDTSYAPPCSANIPIMTDETIRTATYIFKFNRQEFATLYGPINNLDTSAVTDMSTLFADVSGNFDVSSWNVSNVKDISYMFDYAKDFYSNLGSWDVSNVEKMDGVFRDTNAFTGQGLQNWEVSSATTMRNMFYGATAFNTDISSWDVNKVGNTGTMFYGATTFNQNLCSWGIKLAPATMAISMFERATACASQDDPVLSATPAGPFCAVCV